MASRPGPSGQLTVAAATEGGWLYLSGALTPYDVENMYDQIATLGRPDGGHVSVEIEVGGAPQNSPELRALSRRMKRLRRQGVVVHLHAARPRKHPPASAKLTPGTSVGK